MPKFSFTSPEGEEYELEGPEGSTREQAFSILQEGIKSGYYKPKGKTKEVINRKAPLADFGTGLVEGTKSTGAFLADLASGAMKIPAAAALAVGGKLAYGGDLQTSWENAQKAMEDTFPSFGRGLEENLGYKAPMYPLQKYGEGLEYLAEKGSFGNRDVQGALNIAGQFAPIPLLKPTGKAIKAGIERIDPGLKTQKAAQPSEGLAAKLAEKEAALVPQEPSPVAKVDPIQMIVDQQLEGWSEPLRPEPRTGIDTIVQQLEAAKQAEVQRIIEERQKAMELEVARQQQLDFNAAERARQEAAPTGLGAHQEILRQQAEQRLPSDNTPVDFTKEFPPYSLGETPYQYKGGIDFQPMLEEAGAIDKQIQQKEAWRQRAIERQMEQDAAAKQEQRIQELEDTLIPLEEQLREQQYTPNLQGQGPKTREAKASLTAGPRRKQGGAIDPDLLTLGLTRLFHGGREFKKWDPKTIGSGEGMQALGPGLYAGDKRVLAELYTKYGNTYSKQVNWDEALENPNYEFPSVKPGVLNELAVDMSKFLDPRKKIPEHLKEAYEKATEALDALGLRASSRGVKGALQSAEGNLKQLSREAVVASGIDGLWEDLGPDLGREIVIFNPDIITQVSLADSPIEKYAGNLNKFRQGGGIHPQVFEDIINFGKKLIPRKQLPDNINTPRSAATISAKEAKRAKARAVGSDVYQQITTKEEALTNPGNDISRITQEAGAGVGGTVRRNPTNKPLKYTRYLLDTATNDMNAYIKQYVTGEGGFNLTHSKLNKQDKVDVYHLKNWLSEKKVDYTPELGKELGLSEAAQKHMEAAQKAYAEIARRSAEMNLEKGLEPFIPRKGYFPSIWDGGFRALVGEKYIRKDGSEGFRITDVISTKSRKEFNDAKNYYKGKDIIDLGRTGLRQQTHGRFGKRDDIAFLLNALAEDDSKFGDLKEKLKTANAISHKDYLGFGVHELDKKGVGGYKGKKPWLSETENMKEALEAEIQYFDQAAKYISGQKLLDGVHDIVTELRLKGEMPNTAAYLDKYMDHVTGKGMQPTAAAINQVVDAGTSALGKVASKMGVKMPENPAGAARAVGTIGNALLMNIVNFPMFATQIAQLYQAGSPELIRAQQQYGLNPAAWATSFARGHVYLPLIASLDSLGMLDSVNIPPHMKEARKWMKDHGMDDFSEVMLSQDILQSKTMSTVKKAAFWPTVLPEKFTRPTFFMSMVDLFHQAGFETKEAIMRAKAATDYTMTDYRPEEAPLMYDRMGVLAPETSALQKYKHNALDQWASRMREAPENKLAFVTFMGLSIALGGVLGLPMMQEMDQLLVRPLTKHVFGKEKSARELLMMALEPDYKLTKDQDTKTNIAKKSVIDGLASAYTNLDIGSRFALSDVAPNDSFEAVIGARLSKMTNIAGAAYDFGWKYQDEQSFKQLGKELVPSGVAQLYNEAFMANDKGQLLNKKGQIATGVERGEFPSRYAISNFRPLQEKVEGELNYIKNQRLVEIQDKQKTASERMKIALLNKDKTGFQRHLQKYQENYGDLNNIQSVIDDAVKKGYITEKQRLEGTPKQSPMSIKRYQEMQK